MIRLSDLSCSACQVENVDLGSKSGELDLALKFAGSYALDPVRCNGVSVEVGIQAH